MNTKTQWLRDAKWGLFFHYLDSPAGHEAASETSADAWNRRVDGFDVARFAEQIGQTGARYVGWTLGQNSGHFCSPNAAYDSFVGIAPSKCSRRDLLGEIADELARSGVKTLAYLPTGAPDRDAIAVQKLEWRNGHERLAEFQPKWEAVIREWSERWGERVAGWWMDGCYFADAAYRHAETPNFASLNAALRAGNPDAIVAFNGGISQRVQPMKDSQADYTAGEADFALPVNNAWHDGSAPWGNGFVAGEQLHVLSFLGKWWGEGNPRFPDELVIGYTKHLSAQGGAVTWDIPVSPEGEISQQFIAQCAALNAALK